MKKRWMLFFMLILVLAACGKEVEESTSEANETATVYESEESLTHYMEGVTLKLDYKIQKVSAEPGELMLEINGNIENEYSQIVYYTPDFTIQTPEQEDIEQLSSSVENEQIMVNPQMETTFKVTYLIPQNVYDENKSLNLKVPAAFKEPKSESSGDALGDFANWEIPIK
ncbi:hypothetical protein [Solibacillus isronensis]|uniref:hypothetical protein n=1 Tax=Solibacillus isronensis TaxID=412383 RepID=UPI0009A69707|nr:hypothetical protein [Solibacillus isronensis]